MKVVVTGGAGFIGANLTSALAAVGGHEVVVVDDLSTGDASKLEGVSVETVIGSVCDPAVLDHACAESDAIVHLAALPSISRSLADPVATHHANVTGTLEVLEAARRHGNPQVIVASSSSVYGANPQVPKHEALVARPVSPYAASKLAAESYALAYAASFGLDVLAFRFFNVFGPGQPAGHAYAAVVPAFVDAALRGAPLVINGDGRQSRDFTFVDSVVAVLVDALARRVASAEPVNLAFGTRTTLLELIAHLEGVLGHPVQVEHGPTRPGDVRHSQADTTRLRALFPDVVPVALDTGLAATVAWFRGGGAS